MSVRLHYYCTNLSYCRISHGACLQATSPQSTTLIPRGLNSGSLPPWSTPESDPTPPITSGCIHPCQSHRPLGCGGLPRQLVTGDRHVPPRTPRFQQTVSTPAAQCLVPGSMSHCFFLLLPALLSPRFLGFCLPLTEKLYSDRRFR